MNEQKTHNSRWHLSWCTFYLVVIVVGFVVVNSGIIPLLTVAVSDGKRIYTQYVRKKDARSWPRLRERTRRETAQLDSLLTCLNERKNDSGTTITGELYRYADVSGFHVGRVEAGVPQQRENYVETTFQIEGSGTYRSVGTLVEQIENSPQSTRIRNLSISPEEKKGVLKLFVDVAVRGEVMK